jgi:hypothetical protein
VLPSFFAIESFLILRPTNRFDTDDSSRFDFHLLDHTENLGRRSVGHSQLSTPFFWPSKSVFGARFLIPLFFLARVAYISWTFRVEHAETSAVVELSANSEEIPCRIQHLMAHRVAVCSGEHVIGANG